MNIPGNLSLSRGNLRAGEVDLLAGLGRLAAIAMAVAVVATVGLAQPLYRVLPNGAQIVVEENHAAPVAAVRFYVGVGSVYEGEYLGAGISHLIEHCCDRGTAQRSAEEIDQAEAAIGGYMNAYTTYDHTCYHMTTSAQQVGEVIDLLGDYVLGATFPEEQVANQIDVVTREIARIEDAPQRAAIELFNQTMFRRHPERYRIIGYSARFNELTREDMAKFHRAYYTPDNLVVVAVGDFDAEEIADRLEAALSQYQRRPGPPIVLPDEAAPTTIRRASRQRQGLQRAHLLLGWRTVDLFHSDLYALDVLAYVLGHGDSARLPRLLRDELGLVDVVNVWSDTPAYGAGSFIVYATLDAADIEKVEQQILQVTERLSSELVGEEELQRAKRQKEAALVYAQETSAGRAEILGTDLLLTGDLGFSNNYLTGIKAVTAPQVREVARKYLLPDSYVITSLVPAAKEAESATVDQQRVPAPRTKKYVLDNGLTVLIRAEPEAAAVHIATATRAGLRYEDEQTNGITRLMAQMLLRGTEHRSRDEIIGAIDSLGAELEAYSGRNSFGLTARCLPDDGLKVLDVLADCLQNLTFPEQEFGRLQQLTLAQLAARREDVDNVAEKLLRATLFQHHPYQFSELGTPSSVQQLTATQVQQFYRRVCGPLMIQGDVDRAKLRQAVKNEFGSWGQRELFRPEIADEPLLTERRSKTVQRQQNQAIIYYGFLGPRVDDEHRYVRDVLTALLTGMGSPGGRLHDTLRGQGLVYATYAYEMAGLDPGYYAIYAGTAPDRVEQVKETIEDHVTELHTELVDDEELATARKACVSNQQISLADPGRRAQLQALDELYGMGYDNYQDYRERIAAVTANQVQDYTRQLLDLQACVIVVTHPKPAPAEE